MINHTVVLASTSGTLCEQVDFDVSTEMFEIIRKLAALDARAIELRRARSSTTKESRGDWVVKDDNTGDILCLLGPLQRLGWDDDPTFPARFSSECEARRWVRIFGRHHAVFHNRNPLIFFYPVNHDELCDY